MKPALRTPLVTALVLLVTFVTGTAYGHAGAIPDTLRWLPLTVPLVVWLVCIARRRAIFPRTALDPPLAAAALWLVVTVMFATERRLAFEFAWPHLAHIGLLVLLVDLMRRGWAGAFRVALLAVAVVIVAISAVELAAWYFGWFGEPGWFPVSGLSIPPLLPTLDLALNISTIQGNTVAVLVPMVAAGALIARTRWQRVALVALAGALLVIEFLTFSRGGLLGALVSIGLLFAFGAMKASDFQTDMIPNQTRDGFPTVMGPGIMPGPDGTYIAYGQGWANVSNTPFREYKHWVHEGGISTPLIAHWPAKIARKGELEPTPGHLIDLMATCVDVSGAKYPAEFRGEAITPMEGLSLVPAFEGKSVERDAIYWEHEGSRAIRVGDWKLVAKGAKGAWELYDLAADRSEQNDLAAAHPDKVRTLAAKWRAWAERAMVLPLNPKNAN